MARKPMVTRTITSTTATLFCVNTDERSTFEQTIVVPGAYKDKQKLFKVLENFFQGEPVKVIDIVSTEENEKLYGMSEQDFIKHAVVLPSRNNKEN